jgi:hypothetical protein
MGADKDLDRSFDEVADWAFDLVIACQRRINLEAPIK